MIVDLPDTTTNDINKKITGLREEGGAITLSRVLTLVISLDSDDLLEDSIEAANFASREHPCRVIVVVPGDRSASRVTAGCAIARRWRCGRGRGRVIALARRARRPRRAASCCPSCCPTPRLWHGGRRGSGRSGTGPVGPVGNSPDNKCDGLRRPAGRDQESPAGLRRRRHRSGVGPHHLLARPAGVGAQSAALRADHLGGGVGPEGRAVARRPRGLAGRQDRRSGATRSGRTEGGTRQEPARPSR